MKKRLMLAVSLVSSLTACSWGSYIHQSSRDYNEVVENTSNDLIVTNILRGRDSAPLSFSDLSQIRGSLSTSLSAQASWPFGPFHQDVARTNSAQLGPIAIAVNPTFDIAPLNTKNFAEGINEPLSVNLLWYYLQRFEPRVIVPLFISGIDIVDVSEKGGNKTIVSSRTLSKAERVNKISNWIDSAKSGQVYLDPKVNVVSKSNEIGPALPPSLLMQKGIISDISQMSTAGLNLQMGSDHKLHIGKQSARAVFCVRSDPSTGSVHYEALAMAKSSVISAPTAIEWPDSDTDCTNLGGGELSQPSLHEEAERLYTVVHLRSVESMFYYLGSIVQDENNPKIDHNLTMNKYLNFYLNDHKIPDERFSVSYLNKTYYIGNAYESDKKNDFTLPILGLLDDLLNLHRDASEIPTTKAVQGVQ